MSYKLHHKHLENVFRLSSKERYDHFILKVCDWEEIWYLKNSEDNFVTKYVKDENVGYFPVWPHPDYAKKFGEDEEIPVSPANIDLHEFIDRWLPGLSHDGFKVGVLPNLATTVWVIDPLDLRADLKEELANQEQMLNYERQHN